MIEVTEEPGTDLIKITVYSTDLKEAAQVANGLADAYAERRRSLEEEERARLGLVTPRTSITVHERATEALYHSRPNTKLQLALSFLSGTIGLVAVAVGAAMKRKSS